MKYLPDYYHQKILKSEPAIATQYQTDLIDAHLSGFGLKGAMDSSEVIELPLPAQLSDLDTEIADATASYNTVVKAVCDQWLDYDLEAIEAPTHFNAPKGWSVWSAGKWVPMAIPSGRTMVYDIETVEVDGKWLPTVAIALTSKGVGMWLTDWSNMPTVIPMGANNIIGWNIAYDRQYSANEYNLEPSGSQYLDLMSMWIICCGMSNQQTIAWKGHKKGDSLFQPTWVDTTDTNSLAAVYQHLFHQEISKGVRDNIVKDGLSWVSSNMDLVCQYCYEDVIHTAQVLQTIVPLWKARRPSDVNRAGLMIMGSCKLPLSAERFPGFYERIEAVKSARELQVGSELVEYARQFYTRTLTEDKTEQMLCLDWSTNLKNHKDQRPRWFKDLESKYTKGDLTITNRDVVILLELTYLGSPILWKPDTEDLDKAGKPKGGWYTTEHGYLPHPEKRGAKLTSLFIKGYIKLFEDGVITGNGNAKELLAKKVSLINWVSLRARVHGIKTELVDGFPLCVPPLIANGTITGRTKDGGGSVWLVTPNPKRSRIGTELKSMVEAPKGYSLVGADVASEEAWLAGIMGDSSMAVCGSTPLGLINIIGKRSDKTDIHWKMALTANLDRDQAKLLVYAGLYGQGLKGCTDFLLKANPTWSTIDATAKAKEFLAGFRGTKDYNSSLGYVGGLSSEAFNRMETEADSAQPQTALFKAFMPTSLSGNSDFRSTRVNWMVQASGVDFRDLLLVLVESFARKLSVPMMFCIAIHDEVRYLVPNGQEERAAYVLQLAHLYTRFAFIRALGLNNLPAGVAWFPEVDIDYVLRKDPMDPQITPTQTGLPLGRLCTPTDLL